MSCQISGTVAAKALAPVFWSPGAALIIKVTLFNMGSRMNRL